MQTKKTPDASTACIAKLLNGVMFWLRLAKVPEKQLVLPEKAKFDRVNKAFNWLEELTKCPELETLKKAYALRPPEVWARYESWEIEGLAEQLVLESAAKAFLKQWKHDRPRLFGYVPKNPQHETAGTTDSG